MGFRRTDFFSLVLYFCLVFCLSNRIGARHVSVEEDIELERELKMLNKPAVKTIYGRHGDIFDCVDIYKQPVFDDPRFKDHKIQMKPSSLPKKRDGKKKTLSSPLNTTVLQAKDIGIGGECPVGTVPIRRTSKEELRRMKRFQDSLRNQSLNSQQPNARTNQIWRMRHAKVLTQLGHSWLGADAYLSIHNPTAPRMDYSASSIKLSNQGDNIEAGWIVNRELFGDFNTRLYTFWTSGSRGCFITSCQGFVVTSTTIAMGTLIEPISAIDGIQYELKFGIFKDGRTGDWWLTIGEDPHSIGYWPRFIFNYMGQGAVEVGFGGSVYACCQPFPQMGSGRRGDEGHGKAAFQRSLMLVDMEDLYHDPTTTDLYTWMDSQNCYTSVKRRERDWGQTTYFGGPGGRC